MLWAGGVWSSALPMQSEAEVAGALNLGTLNHPLVYASLGQLPSKPGTWAFLPACVY